MPLLIYEIFGLDTSFCIEALEEAIEQHGTPEIFNTDQGSQFTSEEFTGVLKAHDIRISMDGKRCWVDNVFVERLWHSVKYEEVYLKAYDSQACLRPRDRFWDIPVPKIDSAFDNLFVPQPSWSPSTTQQLRKLVAAPYLAPNDWTPRSEAYFVFPLAQGTPGK